MDAQWLCFQKHLLAQGFHSFEAGMTELGGHAIYLDWRASNFQLSDIDFEGRIFISQCFHYYGSNEKHEDLLTLKTGSHVPVINGCCNLFHPCQALADLLTIRLDRGSIKGLLFVMWEFIIML